MNDVLQLGFEMSLPEATTSGWDHKLREAMLGGLDKCGPWEQELRERPESFMKNDALRRTS